MDQTATFLKYFSIGDDAFVSKISKLIYACECSENLMISVYNIDKKCFLYHNKKFEKNIGNYYNALLHEDLNFWFSMIMVDEVLEIKYKLFSFLKTQADQDSLTLRYTVINQQGKEMFLKHEISLYKMEQERILVNYFFDISDKKQIERCIKPCDSINNYNHIKKTKALISPREKEVLRLIADGFSSKQIAHQLFISNHTAISHRKHLIEKFKVKNTAQLIKEASKIMEL
ncbi:response regulator transcription factor [uncultured Lacinutrix sp.]|uniref:response regulator transcription factor n=1 Tax=uncultured Lacinutrix sp. TaxID=574032 RepID=UPI002629BB71|nr:helix-turn-helix transcriptional regulator [uncultured Lacinutrix sp.]